MKVTGFPAEGDAHKKESWEEQRKGFNVFVTTAVNFSETVARTMTSIVTHP